MYVIRRPSISHVITEIWKYDIRLFFEIDRSRLYTPKKQVILIIVINNINK